MVPVVWRGGKGAGYIVKQPPPHTQATSQQLPIKLPLCVSTVEWERKTLITSKCSEG